MKFINIIGSVAWEYLYSAYEYLSVNPRLPRLFPENAPESSRNILFLPGFYGYNAQFFQLARIFKEQGFGVYFIWKYNSFLKVKENVVQLEQFFARHQDKKFYLICHSKAGIVAKQFLLKHPEMSGKIPRVITIATPYQGTVWGYSHHRNSQELAPDSAILAVNEQNTLLDDKFVQFYGEFDQIVVPHRNLVPRHIKSKPIKAYGHGSILRSGELAKELLHLLK